VVGSLTAVQTDQVLWYLVLCSAPDIRIMCVPTNPMAWRLAKGSSSKADIGGETTTIFCWIPVWQTGQNSDFGRKQIPNADPDILPFDCARHDRLAARPA
jgi:hypothetical protein